VWIKREKKLKRKVYLKMTQTKGNTIQLQRRDLFHKSLGNGGERTNEDLLYARDLPFIGKDPRVTRK
jgi:hypothetical protein